MLGAIEEKVLAGERLDAEDGAALFAADDIHALGRLANLVRERRHGDRTTYVKNMHLNYTNVCVHECTFCGFARKPGQEGGWEMSVADAVAYAERAGLDHLSEIHIVGGVHPKLPYAYYTDLLAALKRRFPHVHVKAFTAVEIEHLARIGRRPVERVLADLRDAGLDSLPGGGAEVFSRRVWDQICGTKTKPERWLDIHRTAHRMGLRSTCTMLYGHIETAEERVDHMLRLRALQDETGGFTAFIPLAFQAEHTAMAHVPEPTAHVDLKVHAAARLLLDNIEHIKAYWIMTGLKMAQLLLSYGCDDLDGTIVEERIVHMAGAESPVGVTEAQLRALILEAGREPVLRDSLYGVPAA
jgi:aminodeoxyfutalosine synthase